jgi:hypothetical protein
MLSVLFWMVIIVQIAAVVLSRGSLLHGDSLHFLEQARYLAEGKFAVTGADGTPVPDPVFPVGYPLFLSVCVELLRLPLPVVVTLQVVILLLSLAFFQRSLSKHGIPGPVFAAAVALYPFPFMYCTVVGVEALAMALLMATVALLLWFADGNRISTLIAAGTCYGLVILVRPSLVSTGPAVLLLAALASRGACSSRTRSAVIVSLTAAMVLMPMAVWNANVFGKFSPLPTQSPAGLSLFTKLVAEEVGYDALIDFSFEEPPAPLVQAGLMETIRKLNGEIGVPEETVPFNSKGYVRHRAMERANRTLGGFAVDRIQVDPGAYALSVVRDFGRLWITIKAFARSLPSAVAVALVGAQLLYLAVALVGAGLTVVRRQWLFVALGAFPLSLTALHSLLHVEARYTASVRWAAWVYFSIAALWVLASLRARLSAVDRGQTASTEA